jgi:capsular polysaccharide biosynthesis protein
MKNLKSIFILLWGNLFAIAGAAAAESQPMRGNAKFNVVAAVLCIIFAGLAFLLIRLDKRVSRLEKQNKEGKK